eukprot:s171_g38.t1
MKEINRLNLLTEGGPALVGFDPVTVLKQYKGHSYGSGGLLALRTLYQQHVRSNGVLQAHQAMQDCIMLMQVIQHHADLNALLSCEIATQMGYKDLQRTEDVLPAGCLWVTVKVKRRWQFYQRSSA